MTFEEILGRLQGVQHHGPGQAQALCPAHEDKRQSLSVTRAEDGRILIHCHAGCALDHVLAAAELTRQDLFPSKTQAPTSEIIYDYVDEKGALLFQVLRRQGKKFSQRRPADNGGWAYKLDDVRRVPYRLPEILAADPSRTLFVVEGEKDADNLRSLGEIATTNPGGTGSGRLWETPAFRDPLRGRAVVILPDNDEPGRKHAARVAGALHGCASSVRVLTLPCLPVKGDVSDWIEAGGTRQALDELVSKCPAWMPEESPPDAKKSAEEQVAARKKSQTQRLLEVASAKVELFRSPSGEAFGSVIRDGVQETWPIDSDEFRLMLRKLFYESEGASAARNSLVDAIEEMKAKASFGSKVIPVFLRTAGIDGEVFHDLGQPGWHVVRITRGGWTVVPASRCPMRFRRSAATTLPLPSPAEGGCIDDLRDFVNAGTNDVFQMLVTWVTYAIAGDAPYPVLVVQGEHGSSKSTTTRNIASLVDPSEADLLIPPLTDEDLMIAANSCFVLAYDNLSGLSVRLSDGLSRVATGAAFTARKKYTDKGLSVMRVRRPIILNGIDELATRHDLADRSIVLHLPAIPPEKRRLECEMGRAFEARKPSILGALYEAIAATLPELSRVQETALPRMAAFGRWGVAMPRAHGWPPGSFLRTYGANLKESAAAATEADPIFLGLVGLLDKNPEGWDGTMQDLLEALEGLVPERNRTRRWPASPQSLSNRLQRLAPALRSEGWERTELGRGRRGMLWAISRIATHGGLRPSPSSRSSPVQESLGFPRSERRGEGDKSQQAAVTLAPPSVTTGDEDAPYHEDFVTAETPPESDELGDGDESSVFPSQGEEEGRRGPTPDQTGGQP